MRTIKTRVGLAIRLIWCALVHGMERSRGGWRCLKCEPIRRYRPEPPGDEDLQQPSGQEKPLPLLEDL